MQLFRLTATVALAALAPFHALAAQMRELPRTHTPLPTEAAITAADLMTRLYIIADDSMGGRPSGSPGHVMTTAYIAAEAQRMGLTPAGTNGSWFQDLPMVRRGIDPKSAIVVGERTFAVGEDFGVASPRGSTVRFVPSAMVIMGGELGDSSTWISAERARGKIVVMRAGTRSIPMNTRAVTLGATERFAVAAAYVVPGWESLPAFSKSSMSQTSLTMRSSAPPVLVPPTIYVSSTMADALAARDGGMVSLNLELIETQAEARNVVAILPGSDPRLRGQYVAVGAHNDHNPPSSTGVDHDSLRAMGELRARLTASLPAGARPTREQLAELRVNVDSLHAIRPARSDWIRNGADDDGSGTVAVLEIAEALAGAPQRPNRSILFVWHAAEELGLLGAAHFTANPTVPIDSIVAQLNMDMVGRGGADDIPGGGPRYVQLVGSRRLSKQLGDLVEVLNARRATPFVFDYAFDADGHPERIYCRSDHAMYARYGVPVTFFTTGLHRDYHQVTDEPQYILYDKMAELAGFVRDVATELGNRAERPKLDGAKPDPTAACRQ